MSKNNITIIRDKIGIFIAILIFVILPLLLIGERIVNPQRLGTVDAPRTKAKNNLVIQESLCTIKHSRVYWNIYVWNQSDKAIKDVHFKMYYYAQSGTVISTGEETIYEVISAGEKRYFTFDEYLRDQVVETRVEIKNALWLYEEGKVYLDW